MFEPRYHARMRIGDLRKADHVWSCFIISGYVQQNSGLPRLVGEMELLLYYYSHETAGAQAVAQPHAELSRLGHEGPGI